MVVVVGVAAMVDTVDVVGVIDVVEEVGGFVEMAVVVVDARVEVVDVEVLDWETCTGFCAALFDSSGSSYSPSSSRTAYIEELPAMQGIHVNETFDEEFGPMYARVDPMSVPAEELPSKHLMLALTPKDPLFLALMLTLRGICVMGDCSESPISCGETERSGLVPFR